MSTTFCASKFHARPRLKARSLGDCWSLRHYWLLVAGQSASYLFQVPEKKVRPKAEVLGSATDTLSVSKQLKVVELFSGDTDPTRPSKIL
jgi:hypothetical protein